MLGTEILGESIGGKHSRSTPSDSTRPSAGGDTGTTDPVSHLKRKAEELGLEIRSVERVSSASEIRGKAHTMYLVSGDIDGTLLAFDSVTDVAIVGEPGTNPTIRTDNRGYDVVAENGADGFLLANLTVDQRAAGGWFRANVPGRNVHIRNITTRGNIRRANPQPDKYLGDIGGPTYYIPATSEGAMNTFVNVDMRLHGVFPRIHFGNRPMGLWTGSSHRGTIRVENCVFEGIPNNSIYGTSSPGRFEVVNTTFRDNGVTCGGRFSHGYWRECDISFNYRRANLKYDAQPQHAVIGMATEQKKDAVTGDPGPDILDTSITLTNVAKGGAGIRAYDIWKPAKLGRIEDTDIHIMNGTGGYDADIEIEGEVESLKNLTLTGTNDQYASIVNTSGEHVEMQGCTWDYPGGRARDFGDVAWA